MITTQKQIEKTFEVRICGFYKGTIKSTSAMRAIVKSSMVWANGNTRGIAVIEITEKY